VGSMTRVEGLIHLGLDVAKNAIVVGVLMPGRDGCSRWIGSATTRRRCDVWSAVPTVEQEAVRDLCRARSALVRDRRRARQGLEKFLLRRDLVYRAGTVWTARHELWLAGLRFQDAALRATFAHYPGGGAGPGRGVGRGRGGVGAVAGAGPVRRGHPPTGLLPGRT
jgi:hypothetical protein